MSLSDLLKELYHTSALSHFMSITWIIHQAGMCWQLGAPPLHTDAMFVQLNPLVTQTGGQARRHKYVQRHKWRKGSPPCTVCVWGGGLTHTCSSSSRSAPLRKVEVWKVQRRDEAVKVEAVLREALWLLWCFSHWRVVLSKFIVAVR